VLESWPPEWHALDQAELDRTTAQKKKDEAKLQVTELAKKRCNEKVVMKVRAICEVARVAAEQAKAVEEAGATQVIGATTMQDEEGHDLSIGQEAEDIEEGMDSGTTSTQLKRSQIKERSG